MNIQVQGCCFVHSHIDNKFKVYNLPDASTISRLISLRLIQK